ncbi:MAG: NlpC/P60 family protein [Firmicutes bacterium]|nr:NlpC/P60 family protein [Bacillota bacterium]
MVKTLKEHTKTIIAIMAGIIVLLGGFIIYQQITQPYAVYANGDKVTKPYAITVNGEDILLVGDEETAEGVVTEVMENYTPEGAQVNSITVDKHIQVKSKKLEKSEVPETVLTKEEAVNYIMDKNDSDEPIFSVTVSADTGSIEAVKAGVAYEDNDEDYEGNLSLKSEGKSGSQVVTDEITCVNGKILTQEEVNTKIVQDAIDEIILQGTKERPADTVFQDYSGEAMAEGDGQTVVNFGRQFLGNPYRWGGTSLTNGCDCSGYIYALYNHFGVPVPRMGIYRVGRGVSLAEAKPGDVVYYPGHYAMYAGNGKIIHAYNSRVGIVESNVHAPGTILSVRRIVE